MAINCISKAVISVHNHGLPAELLTDFVIDSDSEPAREFDNQRPHIIAHNGQLILTWERRFRQNTSQLVLATLNENGNVTGRPEIFARTLGDARYPQTLIIKDRPRVLWFGGTDEQSNVYLTRQNTGGERLSDQLNLESDSAAFPTAVVYRDSPYFFWTTKLSESTFHLTERIPDTFVPRPTLIADNFVPDRPTNIKNVRIRWQPPDDISGITGYNYIWTQDPERQPRQIMRFNADRRSINVLADRDGFWYLRLVARDDAGNWSSPTEIRYQRDGSAPPSVVLPTPELDEQGFATSNTITIEWEPPPVTDLIGYSVAFNRLGDIDTPIEVALQQVELPRRVVTSDVRVSRTNIDNGLWVLSVAPIDKTGNLGVAATLPIRFNKYIPTTEIYRIATSVDQYEQYKIDVTGRGFTTNGVINRFILDGDGQAPYDYTYDRGENGFQVINNSQVAGPLIANIRTGSYRLGLGHPGRGIHFAPERLSFTSSGTIVYGDYTIYYGPEYRIRPRGLVHILAKNIILWLVVLFLAMVVLFSTTRIVAITNEGRLLRGESLALLRGERTADVLQEAKIQIMRRKGTGLRLKFTLFVTVLIVSVILAISLILSNTSLQRQESILVRGLEERIQVLLDSVATQASSIFIGSTNLGPDLQPLTDQRRTMEEALYITISGQGRGATDVNYVWASNDSQLLMPTGEATQMTQRQLDTQNFIAGDSRIEDQISDRVDTLREEINERTKTALGEIPEQINLLNSQIVRLITVENRFEDDPEFLRLDNTVSALRRQLAQTLGEIGAVYDSVPLFDTENLSRTDTEYIFYRPVLAWRPGDDPELGQYYRGVVRLGISAEIILQELQDSRRELIISTMIVALIALGAGVAGALFLATIIVIPIGKLVRGVELIQDTDDKSQLSDHVIKIKTRDELSVLADTINSMTQGLVRAAAANKDLTIGKEVQKMFIPLQTDNQGKQTSTALDNINTVEFAGYYEGAKGVSGDYFTYVKLDDYYYAIIKCDVSGKGVSAALIMVEVATIFNDYFSNWTHKTHGLGLSKLVTRINDLLENMNFQGRFAAFTLGILNTDTGQLRVCNAGDTQMHIYRAGIQSVEILELQKVPAAGVFSSDMIPTGFPEIDVMLTPGDILLLFTDGVDESKRLLRTADYSQYTATEHDVQLGNVPEDMVPGSRDEEMGLGRIHAIIEAIMQQRTFQLQKLLNPVPDEQLVFDFQRCEPTAENVVLGLIAVEKIFRLYKNANVGVDDRVSLDRSIDSFLRRYFKQFGTYFNLQIPNKYDPQHLIYSHLKEDEQYDDLTILAIRKK